MLTWKLSKFLTPHEENAWLALAHRQLGKDIHPNRQRGFLLARNALRLCFDSLNHSLPIEALELDHFDQVKNVPHFTLSLSHTPQWGAAIVASHILCRTVGIDIEPIDRVVKEEVIQRISHPEDSELKAIELWCLKEAAFKAVMNTRKFEKNIEFSSLKIHKNGWFYSKELQGEWKLDQQENLVIGIATLI